MLNQKARVSGFAAIALFSALTFASAAVRAESFGIAKKSGKPSSGFVYFSVDYSLLNHRRKGGEDEGYPPAYGFERGIEVGYQLSKHFAIELEWSSFSGSSLFLSQYVSGRFIGVGLKATLPTSSRVNHSWFLEVTPSYYSYKNSLVFDLFGLAEVPIEEYSSSGYDLFGSVSLGYERVWDGGFVLGIEYRRRDLADFTAANTGLSLGWRFH